MSFFRPRRYLVKKLLLKLLVVLFIICLILAWRRRNSSALFELTLTAADEKDKKAVEDKHGSVEVQEERIVQHVPKAEAHAADSVSDHVLDVPKVEEAFVKTTRDWTEIDREIAAEFAKVVPGVGEKGAEVKLTAEEKEIADKLMKKEAFNILASDKITVNRTTPDNRHSMCKNVAYDDDLPSASVVIIFTNEAWSPLLRTIHTVINYTPASLLHEIVLIDDFSDRVEMKDRLDRYVERHLPSKVKLIRSKERLGLIRARLEGAKAATGRVLVFLDSHCEATVGWLEPLLQRIKENRHAVLLPVIDVIDDATMKFFTNDGSHFQVGSFTWSGHFTWINIPQRELDRRGSLIAPTRSPTMAGGLFAVDRKFFWEIGGYDSGMDVWGGENLEMSFRIWMCGGLLETIPCSHVGHIFRSFHPYTFPGNKDTHGINTVRMAEVWMDDYKRLFYLYRKELETVDYGDVSERKELRKKLGCTSFQWFLENIIPEKFILDEDVVAYGRVRNGQNENICLDMLQRDEKSPYNLGLYSCHMFVGASQFMALSKNNEFRREEVCAEVTKSMLMYTDRVLMTKCHGLQGSQEWTHTKHGPVIHKKSGKCLDLTNLGSDDEVLVRECDGSKTQNWSFDVYI